jgi:hypothetical protein
MAEMNIAEFEDLAAAWGADLSHWPARRRAAAEALLAGPDGAAAAAALARARALDEALAALADEEAAQPLPDALAARILADAAAATAERAPAAPWAAPVAKSKEQRRGSWLADFARTFGGWRIAALSAAACALIGLAAGYAAPDAAVATLGLGETTQSGLTIDIGWADATDEDAFGMFGDAG